MTESQVITESTKSSKVSSPISSTFQHQENGENDESNGQSRYAELITLENCNKGLGLKICGGCTIDGKYLYGVYIKYVIPGGVAANSGQLQNGDQILMVNEESLEGVTKERAISILRKAAAQNHAEILVTRDKESRLEYIEVLDKEHCLVSSPVNDIITRYSPFSQGSMNGYEADTPIYHNGVQDFIELDSPWKQFASHPGILTSEASNTSRNTSLTRKTTLDPSDKLHIDTLQGKLGYIGIQPTPDKLHQLHQYLTIDPYGQVTFGNFMQAVKLVFKHELATRHSITSSPGKSPGYLNQEDKPDVQEDLQSVCQERDDLKHEVQRLENVIKDREMKYEKELLKMRKETQGAIEENRSLKTRVHLAEQAQGEAQTLEHDYEEAVAFLENEIRDLRLQLKKESGTMESNKHVASLACQLKKSEARQKMYQAATEKLVAYVEHVQEVLTQPTENSRNNESEEKKKIRREKKKESVVKLLSDGQNVIKLVKSLTESAPLPFGWEDAFSEDGTRYFINHVTQTTSWTHPASGVAYRTDNKNKPSTSHAKH